MKISDKIFFSDSYIQTVTFRRNYEIKKIFRNRFLRSIFISRKRSERDEFFWLGEMNKATAVINSEEGLLDKAVTPKIARGIEEVITNGSKPGAKRPKKVIAFEPLLIKAAGMDVTMLHIGRSSQDMHATYRAAILRDEALELMVSLSNTMQSLLDLAEKNKNIVVF